MKAGDQIITLVEIDQPLCQLEYGFTPCQAQLGVTGTRKCHNTRVTCQDPGAYSPVALPLRFARPQEDLLPYGPLIPILESVDTSPASVNLAAMDKSSSGFGQREKVTLKMNDVLHSDLLVDKYRLQRITGEAAALEPWVDIDLLSGALTPRYGQGSGSITVTRAGNTATRVNASGLVELVNANLPRFDYDPVTLACTGLLIEEARLNFALRFDDYANASWIKSNMTVASDAVAGPAGPASMDSLTRSSAVANCFTQQVVVGSATTQYTLSIYAKAKTTGNRIALRLQGTYPSRADAVFDLATGTIVGTAVTGYTGPSATIEAKGGGVYRCTLTATSDGTSLGSILHGPTDSSLAVNVWEAPSAVLADCYAWGVQVEAGATASSVIPTTSAAVTRNADDVISTLGSWFNASEGTAVVECAPEFSTLISRAYHFDDGTNANRIGAFFNPVTGQPIQFVVAGGVVQVNMASAPATLANKAVARVASVYKASRWSQSCNGGAVATQASGSVPVVTRLRLGSSTAGVSASAYLNGRLRRFTYYPRALTDANLITISGSTEAPEAVVPFLGTYDPYTSGTFWGKWIARNPYHSGYAVRVYEGVVGETVDYMRVRHYIVDRIDGPSDGQVTITCKDLFSKVEARKALAPLQSSGELKLDITNVAGTLTLNPAGIGDALNSLGAAEYPTSGHVCIGDECIAYTRTPGSDVLTLTTRGALNTTASEHHVQDLVQLVLSFVSTAPHLIAKTLLTNFAGLVDGVDFVYADWAAKATEIVDLYTGRVVEPTAVSDLIAELEQQAGFTLWPDVYDGQIKFTALRAASPIETVSDDQWIKDGSLSISRLDSARVSQVWVHYGQVKPTGTLTDRKNFYSTLVEDDPGAESETQYDGITVREVFSRWIPQFGRDAASRTAQRLLAMFRDAPVQAEFTLYADKVGRLSFSDYFNLLVDEVQDEFGAPTPVAMAALMIENGEDYISVKGQSVQFPPAPPPGSSETIVYIENDVYNVNFRTIYDSLFAAPTGSEVIRFVVEAGVKVGSTSTGSPAARTGTWPVGVTLSLDNHGRIQGKGGDGGHGGDPFGAGAGDGTAGGVALQAEYAITVDNTDGQIWGGGGGGGGGAANWIGSTSFWSGGGGGAGGAGFNPGAGAREGSSANYNPSFPPTPQPGSDGGTEGSGTGGAGFAFGSPPDFSGAGGDGGGPGLAGAAGGASGGPGSIAQSAGAGGAAGNYIVGNAFVTWAANGDRRGGVS